MANPAENMDESTQPGRYAIIKTISDRRRGSLAYLKRTHEGKVHWMNVVQIAQDDILDYVRPLNAQGNREYGKKTSERILHWFYFGVSLAPILKLPDPNQFVRALAQMIKEFEYYGENPAVQNIRNLLGARQQQPMARFDVQEPVNPKIKFSSGGSPVYDYFSCPNAPCTLDYFEVVYSLCDLLSLVYARFDDEIVGIPSLYDAILKQDQRLKKHFLGVVVKDVDAIGKAKLKENTASLETLFKYSQGFATSDAPAADAADGSEDAGGGEGSSAPPPPEIDD